MIVIENFSGINEEGLDKIILDIYNSTESIHKIFDNISDSIEQTSEYFQTNVGEEFRIKFDNYKINFNLIHEKLLKYAENLANVKMKYQDLSVDVAKDVKISADNISEQFK